MFSRGNRSVLLEDALARDYTDTLSVLYRALPDQRRRSLSRRTAEDLLQRAILTGLNTPPEKTAEIVRELEKGLLQSPTRWELYFAVDGVSGARHTMGHVRFSTASKRAIRAIERRGEALMRTTTNTDAQKESLIRDFRATTREHLDGCSIAFVKVEAVDRDSAVEIARDEVRAALDAIHFVDSLITNRGISRPASIDGFESSAGSVLTLQPGQSFSYGRGGGGRFIQMDAVFGKDGVSAGVRKVSRLFAASTPTDRQLRTKTAIAWFGRATHCTRTAEAFLFYLIALESLLLGGSNTGELTYRLRLRAAHLLGRGTQGRKWVFDQIAGLYAIRSAIVHRGVREVVPDDLGTARLIVQRAIFDMIHTRRISKRLDLEEWFNRQALN